MKPVGKKGGSSKGDLLFRFSSLSPFFRKTVTYISHTFASQATVILRLWKRMPRSRLHVIWKGMGPGGGWELGGTSQYVL